MAATWFDNTKVTTKKHPQFEPLLSELTPRQRKQREVFGNFSSTPKIELKKPVAENQCFRKCQPSATQSWVKHVEPGSHKLQSSLLIPATMPWTVPQKNYQSSTTCDSFCKQKQTDLLPATMPWVTELPHEEHTGDFRRKKGFMDELVVATVVDVVPQSYRREPLMREPVAIRCLISGLGADSSEKSVRNLLAGFHIVTLRLDIDILTNMCKGSAVLLLRLTDPKCNRLAICDEHSTAWDLTSLEARVIECGLQLKILY